MSQGEGGGPKRTELQREADLAEIARLDRRGYSSYVIAGRIGVSRQQVDADKKLIRQRSIEEQKEHDGARIAELEGQLNDIYVECWEAFEQSKLDAKKVVRKEEMVPVLDDEGNPTGESTLKITEIATTTEGRLPAAVYLSMMERIIAAKRAIYGTDAPTKRDIRTLSLDWEQLMKQAEKVREQADDEVERELEQHIKQIPHLPPAEKPTNGAVNGFKEITNGETE